MNIHDWSQYQVAFPATIVLVWDMYVCVCGCFSVFLRPCVGGKKGPWPERENERKTEIENQTRTQCSSEYS